MIVDELVRRPGSWLSMSEDVGIVVSSRIRLARNLKGVAFPGWASEADACRLYETLGTALRRLSIGRTLTFISMADLSDTDRQVLKERHLISQEFVGKGAGSGVVLARDERLAIMINEEDHLRMQAMSPALRLPEIWERMDAVDSELERHLSYAFSPNLGYLTACPTNVGTGLRASVMMHLPGLRLLDEIDPVIKGLCRMRLEVRGLFGEGTEAHGNMFQVSNRTTLGESETAIVERLTQVASELRVHEQNARQRLLQHRKVYVLDHVSRALAVLKKAYVLSSREAVNLLSAIRLGIDFGLIRNLSSSQVNKLLLLTEPGHLQKMAGESLEPGTRDEIRAGLIAGEMRKAGMTARRRSRTRDALIRAVSGQQNEPREKAP